MSENMKYAGLAILIFLGGCAYEQKGGTQRDAAASLPTIPSVYSDKDKSEKEKPAEAKATGSVNTLIDLLNDTHFGVEEYLTSNGYRQQRTSLSSTVRVFKFLADTNRIVQKSFGSSASDKYVLYSFTEEELFKTIRNQANALGYRFVENRKHNLANVEVFSNNLQEIQFWDKVNGVYSVLIRNR